MKSIPIVLVSFQLMLIFINPAQAQTASISGRVKDENKPVSLVTIRLTETKYATVTDSTGNFAIADIPAGKYFLTVSCIGYDNVEKLIVLKSGDKNSYIIPLVRSQTTALPEVVITGVSRATLIRESPVAVTSISAKTIEQTSENNIIDILVRNTPGLNAVKTGPNISKPFIRGLGYNRVLTLYDGIRQEGQQWGDEHGIEVDEYNLDRAEVIKGPASLMFGSDALAGVISFSPFIPKDADGKWHGKFISEYQANNNLIGDGIRFGYNGEHFILSASGSYRIAKNYRNAYDGRVYNTGFNEKNISLLTGYKSDNGFSHINFTLYDNLQGIPDGSRDSLTRKFTKQIFEGDKDTIANRPVVTDNELNSYQLSPLHQHIQHYRAYTHNKYKLRNGDIDGLLGFQQNIRREFNHPSQPEQAGLYVRLNTINYSVQYTTSLSNNIETTAGINGMTQSNKSKNATDFPIPDYNLLDGGMYIYAKWKNSRWTVSGGYRYDIRNIRFTDFFVRTDPITSFDQHIYLPDTTIDHLVFPAFKKKFGGASASLGSTYLITKQLSIKANVGRGYRAPAITEIASNGLDPGAHIIYRGNRSFIPEFSLQEDVGLIANYKNVSGEWSVFNNNIKNYIYLSLLVDMNGNPVTDAQGNKTYQYQQASAQLFGMEASINVHPEKLKGFNINNNLAVIYGYNRQPIYRNKKTNGEYLPLMPPAKLSGSLSQIVKPKLKQIKTVTTRIEWELDAAQRRFLGLNNTETFTPSYTLINAGLLSEISLSKKETIQFQFQVNNIFNKTYQSGLSRLKYFEYYAQSPGDHSGIYNMGRNICLKMILPF